MDSNDELAVAAGGSVDVDRWWQQIQDLWLEWFSGCFGRVEIRQTAGELVGTVTPLVALVVGGFAVGVVTTVAASTSAARPSPELLRRE